MYLGYSPVLYVSWMRQMQFSACAVHACSCIDLHHTPAQEFLISVIVYVGVNLKNVIIADHVVGFPLKPQDLLNIEGFP